MSTFYNEPGHNSGPTTTATSKAEGRMKESWLPKKKKRQIIMDGIGGCGKKKK